MSRRNYRSRHRIRSHEEAHAGGDGPSTQPIYAHPLVPANEPTLITTEDELASLLDRLRSAKSFAYDSEFIGEETYYPKLCVIQVATPEEVVLIDPLALESQPTAAPAPQPTAEAVGCGPTRTDGFRRGLRENPQLHPFWELLADPSVEKIVHAGQQDLEPVVRHLGLPPASIFDTQVAAGFCGRHYPSSLTKLIAELISPEAAGCVGAKFSQWDRRPLTPVQMRYAANDVRYLPLLRHVIGEELSAKGNVERAAREFQELCDPALYRFDASSQRMRIRGVERLGAPRRAVLRALVAWRDEEARRRDLPPRTLVADGVLYDMARNGVAREEDLHHVRGLPRSIKRQSRNLLDCIRAAREEVGDTNEGAAELREGAELGRPPHEERELVESIWHAMRERAHEHSIDPALVTSKREITALVRSIRAAGKQPDFRILRKNGWRYELMRDVLRPVLETE